MTRLKMGAFLPAGLDVCGFVKRVAGNGDDVEVLRTFDERIAFYMTAIGHDEDGFEPQVLFAIFD